MYLRNLWRATFPLQQPVSGLYQDIFERMQTGILWTLGVVENSSTHPFYKRCFSSHTEWTERLLFFSTQAVSFLNTSSRMTTFGGLYSDQSNLERKKGLENYFLQVLKKEEDVKMAGVTSTRKINKPIQRRIVKQKIPVNVEERSSEQPGRDAEEGDHSESSIQNTKKLILQRRFKI